MSDLIEFVLSAAVPALTIILTWLASTFVSFLNAKKAEANKKIENETLRTYVDLVSDNAVNVVTSLNQMLVNELKAANADGKLTEDEIKIIKTKALNMLIETTSDDVLEIIEKMFGDVNVYLANVIEKSVVLVKSWNK